MFEGSPTAANVAHLITCRFVDVLPAVWALFVVGLPSSSLPVQMRNFGHACALAVKDVVSTPWTGAAPHCTPNPSQSSEDEGLLSEQNLWCPQLKLSYHHCVGSVL